MATVNATHFAVFPNLQTLNLSHSGVQRVLGAGFRPLTQLRVLDLRGCPLTDFPPALFAGLARLQALHADNYKLCCPAVLPEDFNLIHCHALSDPVSSCQALLKSNTHSILFSVYAALALLGNGAMLTARIVKKTGNGDGFGVVLSHLASSDFIMGVYLALIAVADRLYRGSYLREDTAWRHGKTCSVAAFLSLSSHVTSALISCVLLLSRIVEHHAPHPNLRMMKRSAHLLCVAAWLTGSAVAAVPLLPGAAGWSVFRATSLCMMLPVYKGDVTAGYHFTFGVMTLVNGVVSLVTAAGTCFLYRVTRVGEEDRSVLDPCPLSGAVSVTRRTVAGLAVSCVCRAALSLPGLLHASRLSVASDVIVTLAVAVTPLSGVLSPVLYVVSVVMEMQRKERERRLQRFLVAQLHKSHHVATR